MNRRSYFSLTLRLRVVVSPLLRNVCTLLQKYTPYYEKCVPYYKKYPPYYEKCVPYYEKYTPYYENMCHYTILKHVILTLIAPHSELCECCDVCRVNCKCVLCLSNSCYIQDSLLDLYYSCIGNLVYCSVCVSQ